MIFALGALGWFGLLSGGLNAAIKLFGDDAALLRYAGADRNLDSNFIAGALCLVFLALASILSELRSIKTSGT